MELAADLTFVGTSYPLQRSDIVVVLANREGENTDLPGDNGSGGITASDYLHTDASKRNTHLRERINDIRINTCATPKWSRVTTQFHAHS